MAIKRLVIHFTSLFCFTNTNVCYICLKNNQTILLEDMLFCSQTSKTISKSEKWEKRHGRIEHKKYELYDISCKN
jgi:hypothetical protein